MTNRGTNLIDLDFTVVRSTYKDDLEFLSKDYHPPKLRQIKPAAPKTWSFGRKYLVALVRTPKYRYDDEVLSLQSLYPILSFGQ